MAKEKSLVEEAIIQMKNLEEAVAENAKGILASTMKEEINELVKESLTEQDEDEIETDIDMELPDMEDEESDDEEGDEMDMDNLDMDDDDSDDEDEDVIDLTNIKDDEEILRVFKLMGPDDNIVVTKDDSGNINIKDNETDAEYMVVTEGEEEYNEFEQSEEFNESGESIEDIVERMFGNDDEEKEFSFDDEEEGDFEDEEDEYEGFDESEELVYEIELDEQEDDDEDDEEEEEDEEEELEESIFESKSTIKPKGTGIGSPKFKYDAKPNQGKGFDVKKKEAPKSVGTGKAKFEYKEGENLDGEFKDIKKAPVKKASVKKVETKEAAHTYGNGSKSGRGLRKGITPNRNLTFENTESNELTILREKNEEYRKALNVFRNKLNEVAVFNSNLAYATRLFTEHSTSKQEKINILRRFDGVETIKESKNLYQNLKDELSVNTSQPMNESMERAIQKAPVSGSAINLIESKTYENPQFLRMKDLMSKLK
jgi:hypothetical protein